MKLFHSHTTLTDAEIRSTLDKYRSTHDQKWIGRLFAHYMPMVYGVCLRYTPDTSEAEDYVMEVYLNVQKKALKHDIADFRSWLYVVTKHYCLGQLRKVSGKKLKQIDPDFMQFAADYHPPLEETPQEIKEDALGQLERCIETLNPLQRRSIKSFYFEHKTYAQIATELEAKVGQVRSFIQNGRRNLTKCMEE